MNWSRLNVWFMMVVIALCVIGNNVGFAQNNFITWNDLTLDSKNGSGPSGGNGVIIVDCKGNGQSLTVQGAIDMVPENNAQRVKIHILPGVYREKVYIPPSKPYISFIGDQNNPSQTVITWHDKASDKDSNGGLIGTWNSSSVIVESDHFCASGITFENTVVQPYGGLEGYQAVALRISGDLAMFYKVRFLGSQDTLLDDTGTHYFYQCFIQGGTDFIFGYGRSLYQECVINVVEPAYAIAANYWLSSTGKGAGFSFVNCKISGNGIVYLGRALGDYARIVYLYTELDIDLMEGGWSDMSIPSRQKTSVFGEYKCGGRGANRQGRVPWSRQLNDAEARPFLGFRFIRGKQWLRL